MRKQFAKFVVIGVISTIVNYAIFFSLLQFLGLNYLLASAIGFITGVIFGYGFNKSWTFGVSEKSPRLLIKYLIVYLTSLCIGLLALKVLVTKFGIIPEMANILVIGVTTCTNFVGTKLWVFKK